MNTSTSSEREIAAPLARVANAVTDLEAYPAWARDVASVQVIERDTDGMPRRARLTFAAGALRDEVELAYVVEHHPGALTMMWSLLQATHLVALDGRYELREVDTETTHVRYAVAVDPGLPLLTALRTKMQERIVAAALDALTEHVTSA